MIVGLVSHGKAFALELTAALAVDPQAIDRTVSQIRGTPARHSLDAGQDLSVPGSLLHGLFFRLPMGHWTRANAEICLLAVRGHPKRQAKDVHQVIISHVEEHSKKPDEVRERIERLMGDVPRIELFARQKADGWDVWGNEAINDVELTT